jgi:hypothetical protein
MLGFLTPVNLLNAGNFLYLSRCAYVETHLDSNPKVKLANLLKSPC